MVEKICSHIANRNGKNYNWKLSDFEIGAPLGRGKFGRVYMAREKTTKLIVAVKTLFKSELVEHHMQHQFLREVEIQTHLKHPNVLSLLTYFYDQKRIFLVLEYAAKGEVYTHLRSQEKGRFPEPRAAKYMYQVADALEYCHKNNVIHRDIKPENLLLDYHDNIKLADFGWSVHAPSNKRKTVCGTLDYLPPEMVQGKPYNSYVDHWCLGVLCYEFLVGKPPFETESQNATYNKIVKVAVVYPQFMSTPARALISQLLRYDPSSRIGLDCVKEHLWVKKNMKLASIANGVI
ncbi:hypothetical protein AAG570_010193 [Ranatra chinensis]|uniref:Aurora kinase n=1 Tax=Ranatra chinensis TaxID=642074 RepID=A0ABD0YLV0_9HEMI